MSSQRDIMDAGDREEFQLFPAWRHAVKVLVDRGLTFGDHVTREELLTLCRIRKPETVEDVKRYEMQALQCISEIKDTLLTAHRMYLDSDKRGGFVVVSPKDQTRVAVDKGIAAISREMRRMAMGTSFVRPDLLTDEDRRRNTDAQTKVSQLAAMMSPARSELRELLMAPELKSAK